MLYLEAPPSAHIPQQTPPSTPLLNASFNEDIPSTPVLDVDFDDQNLGEHQELEVDQTFTANQHMEDAQDIFQNQHLVASESESPIASHTIILSEDADIEEITSKAAEPTHPETAIVDIANADTADADTDAETDDIANADAATDEDVVVMAASADNVLEDHTEAEAYEEAGTSSHAPQ